MLKSLTELLNMARRHADLTGDGAEEMAPGVTTAEAHVAAWHALGIQGGSSSPQMEAWRLSADKGLTSRSLLSDRTKLNSLIADSGGETPVDFDLVGRCIGTDQIAAGLAAALAVPELQEALTTTPQNVNDRGEFTGTDGKLYHWSAMTADNPADAHDGPWLTCDGCNPVRVIEANPAEYRFTALRAEYAEAKAAADAADERFKAAKDKLKTALSEATNGATRASLRVPGYKPLNLTYVESWRLDTKALQAQHPAVYVEFAKRSGSWRLEESRGK